jgi:hypothetical protein
MFTINTNAAFIKGIQLSASWINADYKQINTDINENYFYLRYSAFICVYQNKINK